jgi:hypothetical protein
MGGINNPGILIVTIRTPHLDLPFLRTSVAATCGVNIYTTPYMWHLTGQYFSILAVSSQGVENLSYLKIFIRTQQWGTPSPCKGTHGEG